MTTPIFDFVRAYADAEPVRFHMPGHKGVSRLGCESLDITEVEGADVLSHADGIIAESEANATALFGTAHTYYATEGSTLAIKTMLALVTAGKPRATVFAARNAHKAFIYAAALLDFDVRWLYPREASHLCTCQLTADEVETALETAIEPPAAVYLTSPDYLGNEADVAGISAVCKRYGVPLLVDNAHGAYLKFLSPTRHPIDLGATMCCDSAHKTLPVLTGGAYLHISKDADASFVKRARASMALFASTSPSYLLLSSLDLCNRYLSEGYAERLSACIERIDGVKKRIRNLGFEVAESEPLKIVVRAGSAGYRGDELAAHLRKCGIEGELADRDVTVLMVTPENKDSDYNRLLEAFSEISPKEPITEALPSIGEGERVLSIREAMLCDRETVSVTDAVGRICATPSVSCPPAVPIVVSGERIVARDVERFLHYGIERVDVVK